jgi:hypothetical protein
MCRNSLFCLPITGTFRQAIITVVEHHWFDSFILFCIVINGILMTLEQHRAGQDDPTSLEGWKDDNMPNHVIGIIGDYVLAIIFTIECGLKILAWGFVMGKKTYLRDAWNILDFIVVCSSLVELSPLPGGNLSFLRLFRVLRPLRSLNRLPELKVLVKTCIGAVPRLGSVIALGLFIFLVFAIIGITLMPGIFYRRCRETPLPSLVNLTVSPSNTLECWQWEFASDDEASSRLCGGLYNCMDIVRGKELVKGYCSGHEAEQGDLRPRFLHAGEVVKGPRAGGPYPWCPGSQPSKWSKNSDGSISGFPETDFVHFDHIGGAFLLIFQSMTMEGWTDLMYYAVDGMNVAFAWFYFFMLIIISSHFLLNVALAVVDEAREDFENEEEAAQDEEEEEDEVTATEFAEGIDVLKSDDPPAELDDDEDDDGLDEVPWLDVAPVRGARVITSNDTFGAFIMFIIAGNVVLMMMEKFPPDMPLETPKKYIGYVFLLIFIVEMVLELLARGVVGYLKNPTTCFDGVVVIVSVVEEVIALNGGSPGGLKALRTLRLFRVLNKFASRSPPLKILLKAMVATGKALKYWLVLFFLVLYICTLMWMHFFHNRFQFAEGDEPAEVFAVTYGYKGEDPDPWCPENRHMGNKLNHLRQGCIPRAHFDNFGWGFVTVFQIMTGENWNTIMYAAMRSGGCSPEGGSGWIECVFYGFMHVTLLLVGQIYFLSLFLSMLLSNFDQIKDEMTEIQKEKEAREAALKANRSKSHMSSRGSSQSFGESIHTDPGSEQGEQSPSQQVKTPAGDVEPAGLPGQLPGDDEAAGASPESKTGKKNQHHDKEDGVDNTTASDTIPSKKRWPHGYSWFVLSETNPIRTSALWMLEKKVPIGGSDVAVFDNFILFCILVSTIFMCINSPLADENAPGWEWLKLVRSADKVFAVIFIAEMGIKLLSFPLVWGDKAYLTGEGCAWNWLDAIVVAVSIITWVGDGPSFLKTLRILRAFRPLRVINRMETLKMVVETIFKSMAELGMLLVVFMLFLLIFALVTLMYLKGTFYTCDGSNIGFMIDLKDQTVWDRNTLPVCFDPIWNSQSYTGANSLVTWSDETRSITVASPMNCTAGQLPWERVTEDTPICVARCNPYAEDDQATALCPRRYNSTQELPSVCPSEITSLPIGEAPTIYPQQAVGDAYIAAMQMSYVVPCGGAATPTYGDVSSISCRQKFCPTVSADVSASCKSTCTIHPDFCKDFACTGANDDSAICQSCRRECEAWCECQDYCTPLIKDAALCHEQKGQWVPMLAQNFDNVANAMLTLLEISTTEGWVDVMYAACDIDMGGAYVQPIRDSETHWVWMFIFSFWIMFSFMFLMNLGVGIIVDKFMEMQKEGEDTFLSMGQAKWVKSRMLLHGRAMIFPLYDLHKLPPFRRQVYDIVSNHYFESFIMLCIVTNTLMMAIVAFPELEGQAWWDDEDAGVKALCGYFFALVFTIECALKAVALRGKFWKDSWNIFDLVCVVATLMGMILRWANTGINIGNLSSVIRIFRIARLFRLLRFKPLRPLNKLFMSLAISLVKLANVGVVMVLFLVLFSILGVNLFSTVKPGDTLNQHGNFRHFPNAFVTLFRASTGEAWNEIMHDLSKTEVDWFRSGDWCTPQVLFDTSTQENFQVLKDKCLIDYPNSCVAAIDGWNPFPWLYWITYTLFIGMVIMNVVIAVILQGYDESRMSDEGAVIDTCRTLWGDKYDPDHRMKIKAQGKTGAIHFMFAAVQELQQDGLCPGQVDIPLGGQLTRIPMKYARALQLKMASNDEVDFHSATTQVLRLIAVLDAEHSGDKKEFDEIVDNLDDCDTEEVMAKSKECKKVKRMEKKHPAESSQDAEQLAASIAALKVQKMFKERQSLRLMNSQRASVKLQDVTADGSSPEAELRAAGAGDDEDLRAAASEAVAEPTGLRPPIAG